MITTKLLYQNTFFRRHSATSLGMRHPFRSKSRFWLNSYRECWSCLRISFSKLGSRSFQDAYLQCTVSFQSQFSKESEYEKISYAIEMWYVNKRRLRQSVTIQHLPTALGHTVLIKHMGLGDQITDEAILSTDGFSSWV